MNFSPGVRSTITNRLALVSTWSFSRSCTRMLPPIISGNIKTLMMNDLVRTAALYSRTAITNTLRMAVLLIARAGDADKDVLQRRPGQLEMTDLAPRHQ